MSRLPRLRAGLCLALAVSMILLASQAAGDNVSISIDNNIMEGKSFFRGQDACVRVTVNSVPETPYFSNQEYVVRYVLVGLGEEAVSDKGTGTESPEKGVLPKENKFNCSDSGLTPADSIRTGWIVFGLHGGWIPLPYLGDDFLDLALARSGCDDTLDTAGSEMVAGSGEGYSGGTAGSETDGSIEKVVSTKLFRRTRYFSEKAYTMLPIECILLNRNFSDGKYYIRVNIQKEGGDKVLQTVRTNTFYLSRWPLAINKIAFNKPEATTGSVVRFTAHVNSNPESRVALRDGFVHFYFEGIDKFTRAYTENEGNSYIGRVSYSPSSSEFTISYTVPADAPGGTYSVRAQLTSVSGMNYSLSRSKKLKIVLPLSVHIFNLKDQYGKEDIRPRIVVGGNCKDWLIVVSVIDMSSQKEVYSNKQNCNNPSGKCEFKPLITVPKKEYPQYYALYVAVKEMGGDGIQTVLMDRYAYFTA